MGRQERTGDRGSFQSWHPGMTERRSLCDCAWVLFLGVAWFSVASIQLVGTAGNSIQTVLDRFEESDEYGPVIRVACQLIHRGGSALGSAKATRRPPVGRPDLPPPAEMTTNWRSFTM